MIYKKLCLLIVTAFIACFSYSQTITLKGKVRNGEGHSISDATLILSRDSMAHSVMAYAVTDAMGYYTFRPIEGVRDFWIVVRCIGYETYWEHCTFGETFREIVLHETPIALDEIVVKGNTNGMTIKGDTVMFIPKAFVNGSEQSLEDVLKKMPGMSVDEFGKISYQGKSVDKLLIDGSDVVSKTSSSAIRTWPADFAEKIDMITNYSNGDIENGFKSSQTLALDIKTAKKNKIMGNAEVGGGIKERYTVKVSGVAVKEKLSTSCIVNANNINEPVFSIIDYMNATEGLSTISASSDIKKLSLSDVEKDMLFEPKNEYKRSSGIGNFNVTITPNNKYKMNVGILHDRSHSYISSSSSEQYKLSEASFDNQIQSKGECNVNFSSFVANQTWIFSEKMNLHSYTKVNRSRTTGNSNASNSYMSQTSYANEHKDDIALDLLQQVNINMLCGKGLTFGNIYVSDKTSKQNINLSTDLILPNIFFRDNQYANQKKYHTTLFNAELGTIYPIGISGVNVKTELFAKIVRNNLKSIYVDNTMNESVTYNYYGAYAGLMKNKGIIRADVGASTYYLQVAEHLAEVQKNKECGYFIEPIINATLYFSPKNKLNAMFSLRYIPSEINSLSHTNSLNGYNDIQNVSQYGNNSEKEIKASLGYQYISLFSRTTLFFYSMYRRISDTYMPLYTTSGITTYTTFVDGGTRESMNSTVYLSKGIGSLPLQAKATVSHNYSTSNSIRRGIEIFTKTNVVKTSLSCNSSFNSMPFNFEIIGKYNIISSRISALGLRTTNREYGADFKVVYSHNNFIASLTSKLNRLNNNNYSCNQDDIDFLVSYKIKRLKLKLSGIDVFHLNRKEWLAEKITPDKTSSTLYVQHPGYVMFSITYSL